MEDDTDLKEAIEECAKIVGEKCKKRPYMIVISKADVGYSTDDDVKKGLLTGKVSYMYLARPEIKKTGLSKLLIDASKIAIELAEKKLNEENLYFYTLR